MNATASHTSSGTVRIGADRLLHDSADLIAGKKVGVLTNHTGQLTDGRSIIDALADSGLCKLTALYGPEHGIAGDTPDGEIVEHACHPRYGIQVYSLYGRINKPNGSFLRCQTSLENTCQLGSDIRLGSSTSATM